MRRMRVFLLGFSLLAVAGAPPSSAQLAVIDGSNLAQTTLAAQRALSELQQLTAQYNQLVTTYQMLTNPTDVVSMVPGLSTSTLQNPLPAVNLMNGLVGGQTPASGAAVQFFNENNVYTPTDSSVASTQLIANANSIANLQGVASTNLQSIQQRLALLPALEAALTAATSITQVNAINGRIAVEANYVQAQQAQAQNLTVLASEQEASARQQAQEEHAREANAIAAQYRAGAQ